MSIASPEPIVPATSAGNGSLRDTDFRRLSREIGPAVRARAEEIESTGRLPKDLAEQLRTAGLFSLALPVELGGAGASAETIVAVVEELTRADASVGWSVLIGQGAGFLGWANPEVAKEIVAATPRPIVAGSMAPMGWATQEEATPAGDGSYRLSGRWAYNSGCRNADWLLVTFFIRDQEGPRRSGSGQPAPRMALLPARAATILDTWDVMGLRGTGSDDLVVEDWVVRPEWTFDPLTEPATHPGQMYRLSFYSFLMTMMAGFPLGIARRALDEFEAVARHRSRLGTRHTLAEDPLAQTGYLRAVCQWRSARLLVCDAVRVVWEAAEEATPPPETRAALAAAVQHAQRVAQEVVEWALHTCGGSAVYLSQPLQRCWRDVNAAGQHVAFSPETERRMARTTLGLEDQLLHLV